MPRYGIHRSTSRKYPRTKHLPWSLGATSDDVFLVDTSNFEGREIVVTEKIDGENTTVHSGGTHARSVDSGPHPSRSHMRALAGQVAHELPDDLRILGENVYATHSIHYTALPAYFLVFGVHEGDRSLAWDEVVGYASMLGLHTVPVLYRGLWDEAAVRACYTGVSRCGGIQEGYVVRLADSFFLDEFSRSVAKFVRKNHVQTDEHWMSKSVWPNELATGADHA